MSHRFRRLGALSLTGALALSMLSAPAATATENTPPNTDTSQVSSAMSKVATTLKASKNQGETDTSDITRSDKPVSVVIMLKDQPVRPSSAAEKANLAAQDTLIKQWEAQFHLSEKRQFGYLVNGFSATVPASQIPALRALPQVASVERERLYYPTENYARDLQGVSRAVAAAGGTGADGTGTVVSVIDTGVDPSHQDMKLDNCAAAKIQPTAEALAKGRTCKVPAGYDYADHDDNFVYPGKEQHGMHVAGIVAANGGKDARHPATTPEHVTGAAPNAQILAMKVFGDEASGAEDSAIVEAIEDSVKLGADIINMSLGSSNGSEEQSNGTYIALAKARQAGVLPVVSAGNDGENFSLKGENSNETGQIDDGLIGSSAVYDPAFAVASVENSYVTATIGDYRTGSGQPVAFNYQKGTGTPDNDRHEIIYAGLGREADFKKIDAAGKYVLIKRGEITFEEKFTNAVAAKAAGIVVYNKDGEEEYVGMRGVEKFTLFSAVMPFSTGDTLRQAIEAAAKDGQSVTIHFEESASSKANEASLTPSTFTSWGPSRDLTFKPQISGIGGNVWSTQNGNTYTSMSGTSMAAPNISGLSALLYQEFKKRKSGTTNLPQKVEVALMNTASVLTHDGIPYAPRQVGAGLAQIDKALATQITATVGGEGSAALGEFTGSTTFTVHLAAPAQKSAYTITMPAAQLVKESQSGGRTVTSLAADTATPSTGTITVPAGAALNQDVTFTVTSAGGGDHFVQGWVAFQVTGLDGQPDLHLPFLGFAGNWAEEPIMLEQGKKLRAGGNLISTGTTLFTLFTNDDAKLMNMEGDLEYSELHDVFLTGLSPNGDGAVDTIYPAIRMLRNAATLRFEILDAQGTQVAQLGEKHNVSRYSLADILENKDLPTRELGPKFDGTVWNGTDYVPVPDGDYIYRVSAFLRPTDTEPQVIDLPFSVDTTPPTLEIEQTDATHYTVKVTDDRQFLGFDVRTPDGKLVKTVNDRDASEDGTWASYTVDLTGYGDLPYVMLVGHDSSFNSAHQMLVLGKDALYIKDETALDGAVLGTASPQVKDGHLIIGGAASGQIASVEVNGAPAELTNGIWAALPTLTEGENTLTVVGKNASGTGLITKKLTLIYDATPPQVTIDGLDEHGMLSVGASSTVTISGRITDERAGAVTSIEIAGKKVPVGKDGRFTAEVPLTAETQVITVVGSDGANLTTVAVPIAEHYEADLFHVTNLTCNKYSVTCFVSRDDAGTTGTSFTLTGTTDVHVTKIVLTPQSRAKDDGSFTTPEPVTFTLDGKGAFTGVMPAATGINYYRADLYAENPDEPAMQIPVTVYFDVVAPVVSVDTPQLINKQIVTDSDELRFTGTVADNGFGYSFRIDNTMIAEWLETTNLGAQANRKAFDHTIQAKDGAQVLVQATDGMGNTLAGLFPVVLDKEAPSLSFASGTTTLADGSRVDRTAAQTITVTVTDPQLRDFSVLVDGKEFKAEDTGATTERLDSAMKLVNQPASHSGDELAGDEGTRSSHASSVATNPEDDDPAGDTRPAVDAAALESDKPADLPTTLTVEIPLTDLATGRHTITATSTDLAGNRSDEAVSVLVDDSAAISGPESVTVNLPGATTSWEDLAAAILKAGGYSATDDGLVSADGAATAVTPTVQIRKPTGAWSVPGSFPVTVVALGPDGQVLGEKTVSVTVTVPAGSLDGKDADAPSPSSPVSQGSGQTGAAGSGSGSHLPTTGADPLAFLVASALALALGTVAIHGRRRRLARA